MSEITSNVAPPPPAGMTIVVNDVVFENSAALNQAQQYVGIPNQSRFPNSFSVDARVTKDFNNKLWLGFAVEEAQATLTTHGNPTVNVGGTTVCTPEPSTRLKSGPKS